MTKNTTVDEKLNRLTRIVQKGFASLSRDLSHRATDSDVAGIIENYVPTIVRNETADIRSELASLRRDLDELSGKADNLIGLPKEIDYALERIAAIERHLGIDKKIAV